VAAAATSTTLPQVIKRQSVTHPAGNSGTRLAFWGMTAEFDCFKLYKELRQMRQHVLFGFAMATWAVASAGCGSSNGLHPVYGKVLYKGEPAVGATVYFHRNGSAEGAHTTIPTGLVQDDGTFELSSDNVGRGAPAGSYDVLIEWRDGRVPAERVTRVSYPNPTKGRIKRAPVPRRSKVERGRPADRLKGRYFQIEHPLVRAEVKPESNYLPPFDLAD
jgi:hypothetical protein